jgi:hypothetical protein
MADVLRAEGFWSYVHEDNAAEGNRIRDLADEVMAQYRLLTASDLNLFVDSLQIKWGDDWPDKIDAALEAVTFFIPIVTPSYFASRECRRELMEFTSRANAAGLGSLLLPIYYVEVPDGLDRDSPDVAVARTARRQHIDWRARRLTDKSSSEHRQGVHELVTRLVEISRDISSTSSTRYEVTRGDIRVVLETAASAEASAADPTVEASDDEPGLLELLAAGEEAMPVWHEKIERLGGLLNTLTALTQDATERMNQAEAQGKGFAGRLHQMHQLAATIEEPSNEIATIGHEYGTALADVDAGLRALFDLAVQAEDDETRAAVCELFSSIREMADSSAEATAGYESLIETLKESTQYARALRPPLNRIITGLRDVADGQAVIEGWLIRIDDSPIDCSQASTP